MNDAYSRYIIFISDEKRSICAKLGILHSHVSKCPLDKIEKVAKRAMCAYTARFAWSTTCLNVNLQYVGKHVKCLMLHNPMLSERTVIFGTRSLDRFRASYLMMRFRVFKEDEICPSNDVKADRRVRATYAQRAGKIEQIKSGFICDTRAQSAKFVSR